jgi:hypothetical protein
MSCCPQPPLPSVSLSTPGERVQQPWCTLLLHDNKHYLHFKRTFATSNVGVTLPSGSFCNCEGGGAVQQYMSLKEYRFPGEQYYEARLSPLCAIVLQHQPNFDYKETLTFTPDISPCTQCPSPQIGFCPAPGPGGDACFANLIVTISSEVYDQEQTLEDVRALGLGSFTGTANFGGTARYFVLRNNDTEIDYAVELVKLYPSLRHDRTVSCFLRVWYKLVFTSKAGITSTLETRVYTWNGTETPSCAGSQINAILPVVEPPETEGSIALAIVKFSILPSYTPPDNGTANGYPA